MSLAYLVKCKNFDVELITAVGYISYTQHIILLYNYNRIIIQLHYLHKLNKNRRKKNTMHIFFIHYFIDVELKKSLNFM